MKKLSSILSKIAFQLNRFPANAGFTMIELLVVIAVIGILSVAVISSIDPIEQINKGRDTRKRSNAAQLINALDRFYAIQERYPWNTATYAGAETLPSTPFPTDVNDGRCLGQAYGTSVFCQIGGQGFVLGTPGDGADVENDWLQGLADTSEVKQSFVNTLSETSSTNVLFLSKAANDDLYICFEPQSNQFKLEAAEACADTNRNAEIPAGACQTDDGTIPDTDPQNLICLP